MKTTALLLLFLIALSSCTKHTYQCRNDAIGFRFIQFDSTEVDTLILKTFYRNTTIPAHDDVFFTTVGYPYSLNSHGDTIDVAFSAPADTFDLELVIPSVSRSIKITEIASEPPRTQTVKTFWMDKLDLDCINRLLSYKVDGVPVIPIYANGSAQPLNIHR